MIENDFYIAYVNHWHLDLAMPSKDWFEKSGETPVSWYQSQGNMLHGLADFIS